MPKIASLMLAVLAIVALAAAAQKDVQAVQPHEVFLPFVAKDAGPIPTLTAMATSTRTSLPTPTYTITRTPIQPFSGVAQVYEVYNSMDGWGWPQAGELTIEVTRSHGFSRAFTTTADANGRLPFACFPFDIEEGDWITINLGSLHTGFPVEMVRAVADPGTDA